MICKKFTEGWRRRLYFLQFWLYLGNLQNQKNFRVDPCPERNFTPLTPQSSNSRRIGTMPDLSKRRSKDIATKRKSSEVVRPEVPEKKRKLAQLQHVPTLVSSTFNPLEEVDFPRGGAALTPLEKKQAENEGIRDVLFEVCSSVSRNLLTYRLQKRVNRERR